MRLSRATRLRVCLLWLNRWLAHETHLPKIGHTWSHANLTTLNFTRIDEEIERLDEAFVKILGVKPKLFRYALDVYFAMGVLLTVL